MENERKIWVRFLIIGLIFFLCRKENVDEKAKQQKNGETDETISEKCGISLPRTISS